MNPQALDLKDIHLPEALSGWPPAIGWWLLALLIPLLCFLMVWIYQRITRKTAVKTAKKQLKQIKQTTLLDDKEKVAALSELIRRVAISLSPRKETASLTGQAWLEYLDSTVEQRPFTTGVGRLLSHAHYQKQNLSHIKIAPLISVCEYWLNLQKDNRK